MTAVPPDPLNEARALIVKGDINAAVQKLSVFLNDDFFNDEALFMLGACYAAHGLNGLSAVVTSAAVDARAATKRGFPEALLNLGAAYKSEHQNETALKIWLDALKQENLPRERAKILTNISGLYVNEGNPERAIEWCDKALLEDPHNAGAKANRGMACLELGRWREGWQGFHATYNSGDRTRRHYVPKGWTSPVPEWRGDAGQMVIVFGDQGVGDELFFANSLPDMIEHSDHVILDCHPRLEKTFARSFPGITVHGTRKNLSDLDWVRDCGAEFAIGLADLPRFFRNSANEWRGAPYIKPERLQGRRQWPPRRIGVSWAGGTKRTRTDLRSVALPMLEPIFMAAPQAEWFSLQYTESAAREVCEFEEKTRFHIAHFPGKVECWDYDETVNFVASLDLVITVCTTIHHVAGSLGVPCWTLVPRRASWRYSGRGEALPWYNSVRCFRQDEDEDWADPIMRIAAELRSDLIAGELWRDAD